MPCEEYSINIIIIRISFAEKVCIVMQFDAHQCRIVFQQCISISNAKPKPGWFILQAVHHLVM